MTSTDVALTGDNGVAIGLEDFDTSDMVMPTLAINHKEGVYEDSLSNEKFNELNVVLLGLIKQRVLWPAEVGDEVVPPLCKSYNFSEGITGKDFPWSEAGFTPPADYENGDEVSLPCASCKLKEWGSNPSGDTPWCSEQHTFAAMMNTADEGDEPNWVPTIFTVQRTGIKPSRTYVTSFARSKTPLFTSYTNLKLDVRKRGSVDYAVPIFSKGPATDRELWPLFTENFLSIRDFVQTPRNMESPVTDTETAVSVPTPKANPATASAPAAAPASAADPIDVTEAPAPAAAAPVDDDLPF